MRRAGRVPVTFGRSGGRRGVVRTRAGIGDGPPQAPAGFLAVVDLLGTPDRRSVDRVELTGHEGGARYPDDPEPEHVDIDRQGVAAVTP